MKHRQHSRFSRRSRVFFSHLITVDFFLHVLYTTEMNCLVEVNPGVDLGSVD